MAILLIMSLSLDERLKCRMHEDPLPEVDEVTMVKVTSITDTAVYVELLEYDDLEGMIILKELQRRRIRSMKRVIAVGRVEPMIVIGVDPNKQYVDLSKKHTTPEDVTEGHQKYNKSKTVHSILSHVVRKSEDPKLTLEDLYVQFGWPLAAHYGTAYEGFKQIKNNQEEVFTTVSGITLPEGPLRDLVIETINDRMFKQALKVEAMVEAQYHGPEGVRVLASCLDAALIPEERLEENQEQVEVKLLASPEWRLTFMTFDEEAGLAVLTQALMRVKTALAEKGGQFKVVKLPQVAVDHAKDDAPAEADK